MIELAIFLSLGLLIVILYEWRERAIRKGKRPAPKASDRCAEQDCAHCTLTNSCEPSKKES